MQCQTAETGTLIVYFWEEKKLTHLQSQTTPSLYHLLYRVCARIFFFFHHQFRQFDFFCAIVLIFEPDF